MSDKTAIWITQTKKEDGLLYVFIVQFLYILHVSNDYLFIIRSPQVAVSDDERNSRSKHVECTKTVQ